MGRKGKKGSGNKGKGGTGGVVDGVSTTEMTREQLEQHAFRLRDEMEREREERNFFQLERDKLRTFWEITRQQLEETRAELRNKDRELEEKEEFHQGQTKVFKQKVKHLLYEYQCDVSELKAENMVSLKLTQEDFNKMEMALLSDKKDLKEKLHEQERAHQEQIRALKMDFSEQLSKATSKFETEVREVIRKYEERLENQREELTLRHRMELTEIDERKNKQISDLLQNHDKQFTTMKTYFNEITLNNLALISNLKGQMEERKAREEKVEKALKEVLKENRALGEPMKRAKEESAELAKQLANYSKDKLTLANTKRALAGAQKELEELKWKMEIQQLELKKAEEERDELRDKFSFVVMEVQQKFSLKSLLLEKKLKALIELLDQREAQFSEVLTAAGIDPSALVSVNVKVDELLQKKNAAIQDLEYELARVCKVHNDMLENYEAKMERYGVPKEEFYFTPIRSVITQPKSPEELLKLRKSL